MKPKPVGYGSGVLVGHDTKYMTCKNKKWLQKSTIKVLNNGSLFTENDGLVEIYAQDFCIDSFERDITALTCSDTKPYVTYNIQNTFLLNQPKEYSSYCGETLNSHFRLVYSVLGAFSLVSVVGINKI